MSFEDALIVLRRRRKIPPALYNERRLVELPIPDQGVNQNEEQRNQDEIERRDQNEVQHENQDDIERQGQNEEQTENQDDIQHQDQTEDQCDDFNLLFDEDSEDDVATQSVDSSQNSQHTLVSVQNHAEANSNIQMNASANDSLVAGYSGTGVQPTIEEVLLPEFVEAEVKIEAIPLHESVQANNENHNEYIKNQIVQS